MQVIGYELFRDAPHYRPDNSGLTIFKVLRSTRNVLSSALWCMLCSSSRNWLGAFRLGLRELAHSGGGSYEIENRKLVTEFFVGPAAYIGIEQVEKHKYSHVY